MTCAIPERDLFERLHGDLTPASRVPGTSDASLVATELGVRARAEGKRVVAVSACLLGLPTRFDGQAKTAAHIAQPLRRDRALCILPVCSEILGEMGCPRLPVAYASGDGHALWNHTARAVNSQGRDQSDALRTGARRAHALIVAAGAGQAWLKEQSPSCGLHRVHTQAGVTNGAGCFAALLSHERVTLFSEESTPPNNED